MLYTIDMLKLAVYIIVAVLVLSFFGISLQHLVESPAAQENFKYVATLLVQGWNDIVNIVLGLWKSTFGKVPHFFPFK